MKIITALFIISVYSCTSFTKNNKFGQFDENDLKTDKIDSSKSVARELYICEGDTIFISERTNKLAQYSKIISCLNKEGKYGNDVANQEIAKIISRTGYDALQSFSRRGILGTLRGETIFEAFLNLGIDDTPRTDMDGNPGLRTRTNMNFRQLERMIESIDGMTDIRAYISKKNPLDDKNLSKYKDSKTLYYIDRIMYNTIKQAWEEGKVVLKPYYKKP